MALKKTVSFSRDTLFQNDDNDSVPKVGRVVFLGAATLDRMRIQRPSLASDIERVKSSSVLAGRDVSFDFVDPNYANTLKSTDSCLLRLPHVACYPIFSRDYFQQKPVQPSEIVIIYDFTGTQTRYDLITYHEYTHRIDRTYFYPHGCYGRYIMTNIFTSQGRLAPLLSDVVAEFSNSDIPALAVTPKLIFRNFGNNGLETNQYVKNLWELISFYKGRYLTFPAVQWTLAVPEKFPPHKVDWVLTLIIQWYHINFPDNPDHIPDIINLQNDIDNSEVSCILDKIRLRSPKLS
jgi:hypothetical protein